MQRSVRRALVLEDDRPLCAAIARLVRSWGAEVWEAHSAAEARVLLERQPDLLIADVRLPDETSFGVVAEAARRRPSPVVVAMSGQASPEEAFQLGQLGVRAYLAKPISVESLTREVETALRQPAGLEPLIAACVGNTALRKLQDDVRRVMIDQALALSDGSRSGAARLLCVSRQAVQQVMRERSDRDLSDRVV